jgi:sugar phosphate isomerase/epimerase
MSLPLLKRCYKKMFPFRLATTSYIFPDRVVPNVRMLAPFFDEIELVFFESESQDSLDGEEIEILMDLSARHDATFNIHLPLDLYLGDNSQAVRSKGISDVKRMIEWSLPLHPSLYTLHLERRSSDRREEADIETWRQNILRSLEEIMRCEIASKRIAIETLEYPFEWVENVVKDLNLSICLDIGHLLVHGQDLKSYFEKYLSDTSNVHLHGFEKSRDHLGIDRLPESTLELIFSHLSSYHGILSLEVFSIDDLKKSLILLEEKWPGKSS